MGSDKREDLILSGSIARAVAFLAGPMLVSALLQNAQSLIDLFWVARLGPVSVAALALSGAILMALFPIQMGLTTGTVALVARAYGAGDVRRSSALAAHSLTLGVIIGLVLGVAFQPLLKPCCELLGAEPDVVVESVRYLRASLYGMAASMLLFLASSALQASGNTVKPMVALLGANLCNLVLDPLFIFGWGWIPGFGVAGAAWATVLANSLAGLWMLLIMSNGSVHLRFKLRDFIPNWVDSLTMLRLGLPSMAQMSSRSLMGLVFFRIIARFGTAVVAGYGIGMRWHMVFLMPCFVLGNAAATMVGQNLGAGQRRRARRSAWVCVAMVIAIVLCSVLIVVPFASQAVAFFDATPEVVRVGSDFLRIVTPFYILAGISIVLDRAMNGAGCTLATMVFTIIALWGVQVPLALLFTNWFSPPVTGVWWAINTANTLHVCMSVAWFYIGRWMYKRL